MHIAPIDNIMYVRFESDKLLGGDELFQFVNEYFAKPQGLHAFIGGHSTETYNINETKQYQYRIELMLIER
jgi:hypothetical protein